MIEIVLDNVSRAFVSGHDVLHQLNLKVAPGEFVSILGPSGCGKSTLLRLIASLDQPTSGAIRYSKTPRVSFVFQDAHLLPWRTVWENTALPLEIAGDRNTDSQVNGVLEMVGLADASHLFPGQLSGGMKMRVSLARALVMKPDLLLLDEPFAALDEVTRFRLDEEIRRLWKKLGMTILFVTHSYTEAIFLADRMLLLAKPSGTLSVDRRVQLPEVRDKLTRISPAFIKELAMLENDFLGLGA